MRFCFYTSISHLQVLPNQSPGQFPGFVLLSRHTLFVRVRHIAGTVLHTMYRALHQGWDQLSKGDSPVPLETLRDTRPGAPLLRQSRECPLNSGPDPSRCTPEGCTSLPRYMPCLQVSHRRTRSQRGLKSHSQELPRPAT